MLVLVIYDKTLQSMCLALIRMHPVWTIAHIIVYHSKKIKIRQHFCTVLRDQQTSYKELHYLHILRFILFH